MNGPRFFTERIRKRAIPMPCGLGGTSANANCKHLNEMSFPHHCTRHAEMPISRPNKWHPSDPHTRHVLIPGVWLHTDGPPTIVGERLGRRLLLRFSFAFKFDY